MINKLQSIVKHQIRGAICLCNETSGNWAICEKYSHSFALQFRSNIMNIIMQKKNKKNKTDSILILIDWATLLYISLQTTKIDSYLFNKM